MMRRADVGIRCIKQFSYSFAGGISRTPEISVIEMDIEFKNMIRLRIL